MRRAGNKSHGHMANIVRSGQAPENPIWLKNGRHPKGGRFCVSGTLMWDNPIWAIAGNTFIPL